MGYVSRSYLSEKYRSLKWDMEKVLQVLETGQPDEVSERDIKRTAGTIVDSCEAIAKEMRKGYFD